MAHLSFPIRPLNPLQLAIHDRAMACAKRFLVAEAELLNAIMEVDKSRLYEEFALTHLTPYCVKILGLSDDVAGYFVRVARKAQEIPELKAAIDEGKISVTKARTIASVITLHNQESWIIKAASLSKKRLEREVAEAAPQTAKPEKAKPIGRQSVRVELEIKEEEMALFRRARDILCQKKSRSVSLAETLTHLLKFFLDREDPIAKADRSVKKLNPDPPRDVSSKLPALVKHAVNRRDRGVCQAVLADGSKCGSAQWIHFHHVKPKSEGGADDPENLVTLCSAHHRQWHEHY